MCERLSALREAINRFASCFDPALITSVDAAWVIEDAAAIEKMAGTVKALAAAKVADSGVWRHSGERSAAHQLARCTGSSVGQAMEVIDTGRRLEQLAATAAAARRGELSVQQASAIAVASTADPAAEARLLTQSRSTSLAELRQECARVTASAEADLEQRRARIHRGRYLRHYPDDEGGSNLRMRDNPEVVAQIMAAIAPIADRIFREARTEGRREPLEAYAADALAQLAARANSAVTRHASTCASPADAESAAANADRAAAAAATPIGVGPKDDASDAAAATIGPRRAGAAAKIIVRVDLPTLLRGYPMAGETCEIVGFGPVAVSAILDLIDSGDPFLAALATKGQKVLGVAHLGRHVTALQRTALEWLHPACAVLGCTAQARLEIDHRVEWADSHITLLELLDRLCRHHHLLKTLHGWALVPGTGKRDFVPPHDPRHPHHRT